MSLAEEIDSIPVFKENHDVKYHYTFRNPKNFTPCNIFKSYKDLNSSNNVEKHQLIQSNQIQNSEKSAKDKHLHENTLKETLNKLKAEAGVKSSSNYINNLDSKRQENEVKCQNKDLSTNIDYKSKLKPGCESDFQNMLNRKRKTSNEELLYMMSTEETKSPEQHYKEKILNRIQEEAEDKGKKTILDFIKNDKNKAQVRLINELEPENCLSVGLIYPINLQNFNSIMSLINSEIEQNILSLINSSFMNIPKMNEELFDITSKAHNNSGVGLNLKENANM
jgi:hypothetical protein